MATSKVFVATVAATVPSYSLLLAVNSPVMVSSFAVISATVTGASVNDNA